jgi:cell division protein FtsB
MKKSRLIGFIASGAIVVILVANTGFRKMVRRYWEIYKLKSEIEQLKKENVLLKKEVFYLEEDTSYVEQIARRELGLIAPGEVEYRFKR